MLLTLVLAACNPLADPTTQAVAVLDDALVKMETQSSGWKAVVEEAIDKLPGEAQSTVRAELTNLVTRAGQAAGEEFRCQVDFLSQRVRDGLKRLRAKLLGSTVQLEPALCDVTPASVDMSLSAERRNKLDISGYDFDVGVPIQVLLARTNETVDVTQHLTVQTHYHMTLNLASGNGVPLSPEAQRIVLRWSNRDVSYVPILQPAPPACRSETVAVSPNAKTYMPPHTKGDNEFFGNVDITVKVTLVPTATHLDAKIWMSALQPTDDHSTAEGETELFRVFTAPAGRTIEQVFGPLEDQVSYHDSTWEDDVLQAGGGPVNQYVLRGDHNGPDAGVWTQVTVYFNTLQIQLRETDNCV